MGSSGFIDMANAKRVVLLLMAAVGLGLGCAGGCGGGATEQSQECRDYLSCYEKLGTPEGIIDAGLGYGPEGTCWGGVSAMAQSCTMACTTTLITLRAHYGDAGC
jgi:hypothetical protein